MFVLILNIVFSIIFLVMGFYCASRQSSQVSYFYDTLQFIALFLAGVLHVYYVYSRRNRIKRLQEDVNRLNRKLRVVEFHTNVNTTSSLPTFTEIMKGTVSEDDGS